MTTLRSAKVYSVVGLGFGDEGKGTTVDYLARKHRASLVVRFNGGAQCAHNVTLPDGRHHTFSQYGSGTFAGAKTHLARFMLVDPIALANEHFGLKQHRISIPPLTIERECPLITPWHKYANKHHEWGLGNSAHGSCGMGIGETRRMWLENPDCVPLAGDLRGDRSMLVHKLRYVYDRIRAGSPYTDSKSPFAELPLPESIADRWRDLHAGGLFTIVDRSYLPSIWSHEGTVIFEGAQGALLDQDWGFQPHTTWSNTTFDHATELLVDVANATSTSWVLPHVRVGVIRAYATRHGAGPLPTEDHRFAKVATYAEPHNNYGGGGFAGPFRAGYFDWTLFRYALNVVKGVDTIALTHLDRSHEWWQAQWAVAPDVNGYDLFDPQTRSIIVPAETSYSRQCRLTEFVNRLDRDQFKIWRTGSEALIAGLEEYAPVSLTSHGQTYLHKKERPA